MKSILFITLFITSLFSQVYKFNDIYNKKIEIDLRNEQILLKGNEGRYLLLAFWGRHCPPCLVEIPSFINITKKYSDKIKILAIHAQNLMGVDVARDFVERKEINYQVVDSLESYQFIGDLQKVTGWGGFIPFSILLDTNGNFVKYFSNDVNEEELLKIIND